MISINDVSAPSMPKPFSNQPISITPRKLWSLLFAVAVFVFLATSYCYEAMDRQNNPASNGTVLFHNNNNGDDTKAVVERSAKKGSVATNITPSSNQFIQETGIVVPGAAPLQEQQRPQGGGRLSFGPVASEVGLVVALQAVFPLVSKAMVIAKQVKWAALGVQVSPAVGRFLTNFGKVWHGLMMVYKKTSISKIVTRTKKMVKIYKYHDDDHHHDHHHDGDHQHENENHHHDNHVHAQHV